MVHLPPDSRLLISLVKQEQAYSAQLHNLLNTSGTSLSALSVYASSSPPAVSPTLNGIASALSGADDALRTYGEALNDWIHQLGCIKQKEEEVINVGRDREILVTRLLKVSQKSKSPPPSLLHSAPDPSSSTSFSTFNSKITNAQAELQACESLLAQKERELESVRIQAIKHGLNVRCSALIRCGQVWGEMGRRALEMLDGLGGVHSHANGHVTEFFKPLPDPLRDDHDSLISSLSPSQSASQIGAMPVLSATGKPYKLELPPPHLVSDNNVIPDSSAPEGYSSSDEEGPVEVHENPRFNPSNKSQRSTWTAPSTPVRHSPVPFPASTSDLGPLNKLKHREKKRTSLFGNIAALFRTSMSPKSPTQHDSSWNTRTEQNINLFKTDGEQSSDEEDTRPRSGRLRRTKARASLTIGSRRSARGTDDESASHVFTPVNGPTALPESTNGKARRSGSIRSTVSEPPPPLRRPRANTLNSMPSEFGVPNGSARPHGRAVSIDGRRGPTDAVIAWKPPKAKGDSLMRIVESTSGDDPSSRLEVVRAPGSAIPRLPLLVHPPPPLPAPVSSPSSPVSSKVDAHKRMSLPIRTTTPAVLVSPPSTVEKKPLRSAMRNSNRSVSPSPSNSPSAPIPAVEDHSPSIAPLSLPGPSLSLNSKRLALSRWEVPSTIFESPRQSMVEAATEAPNQSQVSLKADDTASISSYETGHENFDDENATEKEAVHGPDQVSAPPPPPHVSVKPPPSEDHVHLTTGAAEQHDLSSATSSENATPARRKSVRMSSLPPQVSATPPALEEYNDVDRSPWSYPQEGGRAVSGARWSTRIAAPDVATAWDDSSSEDETYKAARKALSRADRRSEKKSKR